MAKAKVAEPKYPVVGFVAVRRFPKDGLCLRSEIGNGTINGRKFDYQNVIPDGSIYVHFQDPSEIFIVLAKDVIPTAYSSLEKEGEPILKLLRRCRTYIGGHHPDGSKEMRGLIEDLDKLLADAG